MPKRPHDSLAQTAASEDLIERLKAAANDAVRLREIVEGSDSVSIAAAFAVIFASDSSEDTNDEKRRKKISFCTCLDEARNRPCPSLPTETFVEVVLFADRDTLDTMQLVCGFLLSLIRERELTQLALRAISKVVVGSWDNYHGQNGWLPFVEMVRGHDAGKELVPKSVHHLASCLRVAFCESVLIELIGGPEEGDAFNALCDMLFHDLFASSTFVGTLTITMFLGSVEVIARKFRPKDFHGASAVPRISLGGAHE
ncbi:hypothetical protein AAVH_19626 [Aphelenchoides avenae]|nr:hypothetical protein AAVH_19626 [Aphelenchus avenae]